MVERLHTEKGRLAEFPPECQKKGATPFLLNISFAVFGA
jgi:hypothetical protein